jgi:NodT family efflux transporter outer membrane factor (OMF) lipoprotein
MLKPSSVLGLIIPLAGCAVGPDYRAPPLPDASTGPFVTAVPGTISGAEPRQQWWRLYQSPDLDALIEQAFAANTDLRSASANLQAAEAVVSEARTALLPATVVQGGATYGKNQQPLFLPKNELTYQGGFQISYQLDLFGRVRRSIEAARADAAAQVYARDAVMVSLAAAVTDAYVSACTAAEAIEVVRSSIGLATDSSRMVEAQERSGSASSLDLDRSQVALERARASLAPLDGQRRSALFELAALLGKPPAAVPDAAAKCERAPLPQEAIPIGDGASLLKRRPDVAESERRLAAATARIGVASADLWPSISLGGSVSQVGGKHVTASQGFSYGVGPAVTFNFPNISVARARVREANAATQASLAQFDGAVLNALKETEQALSTYASEQQHHLDLSAAEHRADSAYHRAELLYHAGSIAQLDLIVTENELLDARLARIQSEQQLSSDRVQLFRALGGGWGRDVLTTAN